MPDPSYPWMNLQVYFESLMRRLGISEDEAAARIASDCRAGRREIRSLKAIAAGGAGAKFQIAAFGQLRIETSDGLFAADRFEIRQRPPPEEPNLLGPAGPVDEVTSARIAASIRQLGGAYVVSPSGIGYVPPTEPKPAKPAPEPQEPPSPDEQRIIRLAEKLKRDQARGLWKTKALYRKLFKRAYGIGVNRFDNDIWPAALKKPGVNPPQAGAPKKKK